MEADDHASHKDREKAFLAKEYQKHPELFEARCFVEDAETLGEFGIAIPEKEEMPPGTLKLWPEDFIVEERADGDTYTVSGNDEAGPAEIFPTLYATLVKCNISTLEAVEDIAKTLGISRDQLAYAGMKDKDAITAQRISLRKVLPNGIANLASPHFFLKDWVGGKGVAQRGNLSGNRFTILIRTDTAGFDARQAQRFAERVQKIKERGFYNFFYLQRFSTPRLRNFIWARLILRGEYEKALRDFFAEPAERELPYFKNLRAELGRSFGDWQKIRQLLTPMPVMFRTELKMVDHLIAHRDDYVGALKTVPDQITLWMYALASLMFNQAISNYLLRGEEPPATLPFFLSRDRADWEPYREMLESLGMYPPPFQNLRPFPHVMLKSRATPTKVPVDIRKADAINEGIILEFDLGKGSYATTFLSHLFNLTAGKTPKNVPAARVDTKRLLGEEPIAPIVERFAKVIEEKNAEAAVGES